MLSEKQIECIEMVSLGQMTKLEISSKLGISERTIYKWQKTEEYLAEVRRRTRVIQASMEQEGKARMVAKGEIAIENIFHLANSANSENVKLSANLFIYEAIFGKATSRIQDITEQENNDSKKITNEQLIDEFSKFKLVNNKTELKKAE